MNTISKFSVPLLLIFTQTSAMLTLTDFSGAGKFFGIAAVASGALFVKNIVAMK